MNKIKQFAYENVKTQINSMENGPNPSANYYIKNSVTNSDKLRSSKISFHDKEERTSKLIDISYINPPRKKFFGSSIEKTENKTKTKKYSNFVKNLKSHLINNSTDEKKNILNTSRKTKTNKKNIFGDYIKQFINTTRVDDNNPLITVNTIKSNVQDRRRNSIMNTITLNIIGIPTSDKIKELQSIICNLRSEVYNLQVQNNYLLQENTFYKNEFAKLNINKQYTGNSNNNSNVNKNINNDILKVNQVSNNTKDNQKLNNSIKTNNESNNKNVNNVNNNENKNYIKINKVYGNINNNNVDKAKKEQKMTNAMKRIRRQARSVDIEKKEDFLDKSEKIMSFAKLLEVELGKGIANIDDVNNKNNNNDNDNVSVKQNDDVINMIENKPVENKKKKKQNLKFDG